MSQFESEPVARRVIAIARSWRGTPYHHQMSVKQAGCDCLGLVRGVFREVYGYDPEQPPPYTADWGECLNRETLLEAASRHLIPRPASEPAMPGDVLIFRLRAGAIAKHAAILVTPDTMVHAAEGAPVCEVHLGKWWRRHLAASFIFPDRAPRRSCQPPA